MLASVTLLPALLGFASHRLEVTRWRGLVAAALVAVGAGARRLQVPAPCAAVPLVAAVARDRRLGFFVPALKREVPKRSPKPVEQTFAYRWSRQVQAHPVAMVVASLVGLLLLASPVLSLRLGFSDEGNFARGHHHPQGLRPPGRRLRPRLQRPADRRRPAPGRHRPGRARRHRRARVPGRPRRRRRSTARSPTTPRRPAPCSGRWSPRPRPRTTSHRGHRPPPARPPWSRRPHRGHRPSSRVVTGFTTVRHRLLRLHAARLPLFFGAVLLLSFLLLMAVFRSILVPLKAVLMNMLSIGAAYGAVRGGVPVGLGQVAARHRDRAHRAVHADDAVRHPLRPLDGLRGLPPVPGEGGVRPHPRQRPGRGRRPGLHGPPHHRRGRDHGRGLRQLPARDRPGHQAVRPRSGQRHLPRRHRRPHGPGAGHDGAAGRPQLVAPGLARPDPPEDRRRGPQPDPEPDPVV